jgi:uncharacterized surface protein with fasciclin (FAS1) repeats
MFFNNRGKKRRSNSNGFRYDQFEPRKMLAGDIRVVESGDILYIRGDAADNQVEITRTADGDVRIGGKTGTSVNGKFETMFLRDRGGEIGSLRVNMGSGSDTLFVEGVAVEGRTIIFGGAGDDAIGLYRVDINEDLFVQTASGDDRVSLENVDVQANVNILTIVGDDVVGIDQSRIAGNTFVALGSGDDTLAIRDSQHLQNAIIIGQSGNDFIGTDGITIGGLARVFGGSGSDDVYVNDTTFQGIVRASGQGGSDRLEVDGTTSFAIDPVVSSFEGDDVAGGQLLASSAFDELILSGARLGTIVELAVLTPELSTLVGALGATGLDSALAEPGPFTVFAPLNSAFAKLPAGTVEGLTTEQLTDVLLFHVASGVTSANQLVTLDSVDTLLEQSFTVDVSSGTPVLNGNATIAQTNIRAKNGIIHLLNEVLIPGS